MEARPLFTKPVRDKTELFQKEYHENSHASIFAVVVLWYCQGV